MAMPANSFPDRNTPGDYRLLDSIAKRTPMIAGGGSSKLFNGTILSSAKPRQSASVPQGPFFLSVVKTGDYWKWKVSSEHSSITDETNGNAIDLSESGFDDEEGTVISEDKYIVLEANVSETTMDITDWILSAVDEAEALEEARATEEDPIYQDKIRLLIGKITFDDSDPTNATATQAVFSAQIIVHDMTNGLICKVFANHTIHPSAL